MELGSDSFDGLHPSIPEGNVIHANSAEIRVPKAAKTCLSAPIVRLLSSNEHARKACGYFPNSFTTLAFSQLAAWQTASVEGFMDTPETFFGSAHAGNL